LWLIAAGKPTGSILNLGFGEREKRRVLLKNPARTPMERNFAPTISLTMFCAWRVRHGKRFIATWRDPNLRGGPMLSGLEHLRDRRVIKATIAPTIADLTLRLEGGYALEVFADIRDGEESDMNYVFRCGATTFRCTPDGSLERM